MFACLSRASSTEGPDNSTLERTAVLVVLKATPPRDLLESASGYSCADTDQCFTGNGPSHVLPGVIKPGGFDGWRRVLPWLRCPPFGPHLISSTEWCRSRSHLVILSRAVALVYVSAFVGIHSQLQVPATGELTPLLRHLLDSRQELEAKWRRGEKDPESAQLKRGTRNDRAPIQQIGVNTIIDRVVNGRRVVEAIARISDGAYAPFLDDFAVQVVNREPGAGIAA